MFSSAKVTVKVLFLAKASWLLRKKAAMAPFGCGLVHSCTTLNGKGSGWYWRSSRPGWPACRGQEEKKKEEGGVEVGATFRLEAAFHLTHIVLVDGDGFSVGDNFPDSVHLFLVQHVKAQDERAAGDAPCSKMRAIFHDVEQVAHLCKVKKTGEPGGDRLGGPAAKESTFPIVSLKLT